MPTSSSPAPAENSRPFVGIQLEHAAFENRDASAILDELQSRAPVNTLMIFAGQRLRRGPNHHGGTQFRQRELGLDPQGRDIFDLLEPHATSRGLRIVFGAGEESWGYRDDFPGYTNIGMVDCHGRIHRQSCMNHPEWRAFQIANAEDVVRQRPWLAGIMFMHERAGPLSALIVGTGPLDTRSAFCFCEHCRKLGAERGLDARRAREGYAALLELAERAHTGAEAPVDGWFVSLWRLFGRYPEILGWDQLWWDSLHDYRAAVAAASAMPRRTRAGVADFQVGYHFQHSVSLYNFSWKAGDDPARVAQYADWLKPSVYPGCSGTRGRKKLKQLHDFLWRDLSRSTARDVSSWLMGRDPAGEPDLLGGDAHQEFAFGPEWVRAEVERLVKHRTGKPVYAGLGIGIPGGEKNETPELIAACAEACFDGGADGILLSRGYLEMKPELLAAASEVIRRRLRDR